VNICVAINKHFTMFFARLAPHLERAGHALFWISPSRRWSEWLCDQAGVSADRILSLPDKADEWRRMRLAGPQPLSDLEGPQGLTISNLILMCRALRRLPPSHAYAYLTVCRKYIEPFLERNAIDVCFGEATWGLEVLLWLICQRHHIPHLLPTTVRIPDDRFAFFDAVPHEIIALRDVEQSDRDWAEEFHQKWVARPRRPVFSTTLPGAFEFRPYWWKELEVSLLRPKLDRGDLTLLPISDRLWSRARTAFNNLVLLARPQFAAPEERPYVLLCLHQQPEAAIDVYGRMHSDQAHLVERIVRLLPSTHELWVKEHIDALGQRPLGWLRRLAKLPNLRMIDPRLSTFELARRAALVISVTGTVSYEAALLGTPAVAVAPIYFSPLMALDPRKYPDPINWPWNDLLAPRTPLDDGWQRRAVEFLAWVHAQSFPGFPFDPITAQNAGNRPDDIQTEAEGFLAALNLPEFPRRRAAP
jgi:hypothetical protein